MKKLILFVNICLIFINPIKAQEFKLIASLSNGLSIHNPLNITKSRSGIFYLSTRGPQAVPYVYRSSNFGYTWKEVFSDYKYANTGVFNDVNCFTSKDSILVVGLLDSGRIKISIDEGKTWKEIRLPFTQATPKGEYGILNCKMVNSRIGAAMTYVDVITTDDGWNTSKKLKIPDSMTYFGEHRITFTDITMPDENSIFISGYDEGRGNLDTVFLISTLDKGKTWEMNSTYKNILDLDSYGKDFVITQGTN